MINRLINSIRTIILLILIAFMPYFAYSQTEEIECLKIFNSFVHNNLSKLDTNNFDLSSINVKLIFELYVSKCGKVDSLAIRKSNLSNFAISETALISSIIQSKFPCIREIYYKGDLIPDKVIIVYNTKFLKE